MLYAKPLKHPVQLLHCLSLSSCQLELILPPAAQLFLLQSQRGDLVGHRLRLSNVLEVISRPSCEPLYAINTSHCKQERFLWVLWLTKRKPQKTTLLFGSILLKQGRHYDYQNHPLDMRMHMCYLDCHGAGLYCYLVIHVETPLHPLQLFYFHLWLIYWPSLVLYISIDRIIEEWWRVNNLDRYSGRLRAGRPRGRSLSFGRVKNFIFYTSSRQALGSTKPPIQWVPGAISPGIKRPGREADHSPPASIEVNKMWIYTSTLLHSTIRLHGVVLN
jgi:hypothetical protein